MKNYSVTLSRTSSRVVTIDVLAASKAQAQAQALEEAGNIDFGLGSETEPHYDVDDCVEVVDAPPIDVGTPSTVADALDPLQALRAIVARFQGVFDDPNLVAIGPLSVSAQEDALHIATKTIKAAERMSS